MSLPEFAPIPALGTIVLLLAGCGGDDFAVDGRELPLPEKRGIYALIPHGELVRLDGDPEWERKTWEERSDLSPDARFIIFDPAIANGAPDVGTLVTLTRVAWLRSELQLSGMAAPATGTKWVAPRLDSFTEPLAATWHPSVAGFVYLEPADGRLEPGLYELAVRSEPRRSARVGIDWNAVDKRQYSTANCVDRLLAYDMRYEPCAAQPYTVTQSLPSPQPEPVAPLATAPGQALKISLDQPVAEHGGLTVRGTVRNVSAMAQTLPMLRGTLLDASGQATESWLFAPPQDSIAPGGEVAFMTWVPSDDRTARLNVDFAG